ncbi:MAG: peroxiredoxin family protein [Aeromonas salmonicida]
MVRVSGRAKEMKRICWLIVAALLTACSPAPEFSNDQGQPVTLAQEGKIAVVIISYDPATPAELGALASRHHIRVPLLIADKEAHLLFSLPTGLPTSYLLDGEGRLQATLVGELDEQKIAALKVRAAQFR